MLTFVASCCVFVCAQQFDHFGATVQISRHQFFLTARFAITEGPDETLGWVQDEDDATQSVRPMAPAYAARFCTGVRGYRRFCSQNPNYAGYLDRWSALRVSAAVERAHGWPTSFPMHRPIGPFSAAFDELQSHGNHRRGLHLVHSDMLAIRGREDHRFVEHSAVSPLDSMLASLIELWNAHVPASKAGEATTAMREVFESDAELLERVDSAREILCANHPRSQAGSS